MITIMKKSPVLHQSLFRVRNLWLIGLQFNLSLYKVPISNCIVSPKKGLRNQTLLDLSTSCASRRTLRLFSAAPAPSCLAICHPMLCCSRSNCSHSNRLVLIPSGASVWAASYVEEKLFSPFVNFTNNFAG